MPSACAFPFNPTWAPGASNWWIAPRPVVWSVMPWVHARCSTPTTAVTTVPAGALVAAFVAAAALDSAAALAMTVPGSRTRRGSPSTSSTRSRTNRSGMPAPARTSMTFPVPRRYRRSIWPRQRSSASSRWARRWPRRRAFRLCRIGCTRGSSDSGPRMRGGQASLSLWQLAPPRLRDFNQRFDADQPSLVVLESGGRFLPPRHEGVYPLTQEYDVLAVLDHFGDETHAAACGAKSSTIP